MKLRHLIRYLACPLLLAGPLLMLSACGSSDKSNSDTLDTVAIEESYDYGNTGTAGKKSESY